MRSTKFHQTQSTRHQPERIAQWPSATPLHQNVYGGLEDLKKTTNFIIAARLGRVGEREEEEEEGERAPL